MRHPIATLYVEELKATMRGRFAWLGAGVFSSRSAAWRPWARRTRGSMATASSRYFLVPLAFIPLAGRRRRQSAREPVRRERVHGARRSARLARGEDLASCSRSRVGVLRRAPADDARLHARTSACRSCSRDFCSWTPGILLTSVAIGTLIGVLFIGRSVAAPAATGMGILLAYAGLVPLQELMVAQGNGAGTDRPVWPS